MKKLYFSFIFLLITAGFGYAEYPDMKFLEYGNGLKIAYEDFGTNKKGEILFIHGLDDCRRSWRYYAEQLSKEYRVVFYDLKGHGESTEGDGDYSFESMKKEMRFVVEKLSLENSIVVAHSFGGAIILHYLQEYKTDFSGIILVDPAIPSINKKLYYNLAILTFMLQRRDDVPEKIAKTYYKLLPRYGEWDKYSEEAFESCFKLKDGKYMPRSKPSTFTNILKTASEYDYENNFSKINREITILISRLGIIIDERSIQYILDKIENYTVEYFSFSHNPLVSRRKEFLEIIKEQLGYLTASPIRP